MVLTGASAPVSVERFFQASLLGVVITGYLALAGSGYLDAGTTALVGAGLAFRGLLVFGLVRWFPSERTVALVSLGCAGFFAADYWLLSRSLLAATVHLMFSLAVLKILTARTGRDHLGIAAIAFLELLAAAILSVEFNFFLFLGLYLFFAVAALASGEIRQSMAGARVRARHVSRFFHWRLTILAASVGMGILMLTAGLFFLLPRTAEAAFERIVSHRMYLPGFSNEVTLGEIGEIQASSRPALHIRVWSDEKLALKWRGGALGYFDGKHWLNLNPEKTAIPIEHNHVTLVPAARRRPGRRLNYDIYTESLANDTLFFAGAPEELGLNGAVVYRTGAGTYRLGSSPPQSFRYDAYALLEDPLDNEPVAGPPAVLSLPEREEYLQRPALDPRIPLLARSMARDAKTDLERARAIERGLRRGYGYTLRLPDRQVADPLAYFLFVRKSGHCEYFASAMAVMLRTLNIPSRLATGFLGGVYNPLTDLWLVRTSDAHSWVEAWIPARGWTTFDPTPPAAAGSGNSILSKAALYLDAAEMFWHEWVVDYDPSHQGTLADRAEQLTARMGLRWVDALAAIRSGWGRYVVPQLKQRALPALGLALVGFLLTVLVPRVIRLWRIFWRVRRAERGQASVADATLLYHRMLQVLKKRGHQKPPWFTPAEFAASLPPTAWGSRVIEFTATYNALRFGGRTGAASRLFILLGELERPARQRN